jgi:hypothetical protein
MCRNIARVMSVIAKSKAFDEPRHLDELATGRRCFETKLAVIDVLRHIVALPTQR